jgi:hypothetical protein
VMPVVLLSKYLHLHPENSVFIAKLFGDPKGFLCCRVETEVWNWWYWSLHIMRKSTPSVNRSYKSRFSCPWSGGNMSLLQLGVLVNILQKLLALVVVGGGHGASKTVNSSWQKQIEMKTRRENDIKASRNSGGYIGKSLTTKERHGMKPGRKRALRRSQHMVARPVGGPCHEVVWCPRAPFPTRFCLVIFHI